MKKGLSLVAFAANQSKGAFTGLIFFDYFFKNLQGMSFGIYRL
jgi:hypothetical protein